jgi:hypothetical protein
MMRDPVTNTSTIALSSVSACSWPTAIELTAAAEKPQSKTMPRRMPRVR